MAWRNSRDSTFMKHNSPNNRSAQPEPRDPTSIADSSNITRNIYMVSVCWLLFAQGWNDASTGPLLHVAQAFYRLNFTMISMLFVCSTVGYISGAIANVAFTDVFGFGKLIAAGSFVQLIGYAIMAVGPPFAVMCLGYAITGFALAVSSFVRSKLRILKHLLKIQNAQGNTFVTQLPGKVSNNMAILHSAYGVGALVAPLVATQFTLLPRWTYFFFVSLGIAFVSLVLSVSVFRFQRAEGLLANISPRPSIATQQTAETEAFEDNAEQKNK
ncbi:hypothetical protein FRC03_008128 [Tulasnella sp. 419]|nr:hypothetical protein FRC03_008128 [Tulasnella sp. 419]